MTTLDCVRRRFIELCNERNLAFYALAISAGVHPSTMKSIMNGQSQNPGIVTIKKLCDGLDISLTEFFNTDYFRALEQEIK
ncbi:MAG: helix-turn-helix transcriptional regulator [Clostridia bacterium]|nr:helix-turn-helix transcriptional regulator [Clostridia bacterium]